jgi:hypothetical protein
MTKSAMSHSSVSRNTVPTGFHGVLSTSTRELGVAADSSASRVRTNRSCMIGARTGWMTPPAMRIGD